MSEHPAKIALKRLAELDAVKPDKSLVLSEILDFVSDLEARLEKARKVIEPFAEVVESCIDEDERNAANVWEHPVGMSLQIGDFRAARAWMEQNDE